MVAWDITPPPIKVNTAYPRESFCATNYAVNRSHILARMTTAISYLGSSTEYHSGRSAAMPTIWRQPPPLFFPLSPFVSVCEGDVFGKLQLYIVPRLQICLLFDSVHAETLFTNRTTYRIKDYQ